MSFLDSRKSKELRVTVAPGLAKSWLVSRLGNFCSTNDDIHLTVDSSHDLTDLRNGQYSYGVKFGLGSWSGLRASKLMDLELFPVCAPALLGKLESIQDLEQVPIIFGEEGGSGWPLWLTAASASHLNLKERSMMSSPDLCIEAAISGMGVTLVWQTMALDALDAGDLVVPFPITVKTGEAYWLVGPESRSSSAAARHFRKWLKEEFQVSQSKYEKLVGAGRLRSSME
ncbi:LysR substrate-binding domain-containing protein [Roseobacter weihaiensis]|uniref:LysR substrate-binding domain-containing protein n=1 Tax=Roseobacter weihaiensis TaxID=2763262 RepID=UPI001D0A0E36|nr:LysR substrate-binding domain-containing protein [Roseobacter sp. H9]